jgi:hypothetical protein
MAKGGPRPGSGRPRSPNKASVARLKYAAETGVLPCDVMLDAMRHHYQIVLDERAKGQKAKASKIASEFSIAHGYARDAAPYYHSRLATLQTQMNVSGTLTLSQLLDQAIPSPANSNAFDDSDTKSGIV